MMPMPSLSLLRTLPAWAPGARARHDARRELERIVAGEHADPHSRPRRARGGRRHRRARLPPGGDVGARAAAARRAGRPRALHPAGVFEALLPRRRTLPRYRLEIGYPDAPAVVVRDAYSFAPSLGELDLHLIGEGRHERLWDALGAHPRTLDGAAGTAFAVWAPAARAVSVVGDFNAWNERAHPMRSLGAAGVWELFVPEAEEGAAYKFAIRGADGTVRLKADPFALRAELPPDRLDRLRVRATAGATRPGRTPREQPSRTPRRSRSTRCTSAPGASTRSRATAR